MHLTLNPRTPIRAIAIVIAILVAANLATLAARITGHDYLLGILPLFDFNNEGNLPTLFSVLLLIGAAALLFVLGAADAHATRRGWYWLSAVFVFLALDEGAGIHDSLTLPLRTLLGTDGILYFAWVIPYALLVGAVFVTSIPLLRRLPAVTRNLFLLAGALYVGGALGIELVEGWQVTRDGGQKLVAFFAWVALEESLEMIGVAVFIHALLRHLVATHPNLSLRFAPAAAASRERAVGDDAELAR